jgi:hypothetical protein
MVVRRRYPHVAWRLSTASGTGLVELVARKHIAIYRNVRRGEDAMVAVYRGRVVVLMPTSEAVDTMLARCEHDGLDLRSTDPVYVRYRSQVVTFARTGAGTGWDHTLMNANTWRKRTRLYRQSEDADPRA